MAEFKHKWVEKVSTLVDDSISSLEKLVPEKKTYTIKIKVPKNVNKEHVRSIIKGITGMEKEDNPANVVNKTVDKAKNAGKSLFSGVLKQVNKGLSKLEEVTARNLEKVQEEYNEQAEYAEYEEVKEELGDELAGEIFLGKDIKEE